MELGWCSLDLLLHLVGGWRLADQAGPGRVSLVPHVSHPLPRLSGLAQACLSQRYGEAWESKWKYAWLLEAWAWNWYPVTCIGQASHMAEFRSLCTVGEFFKGSWERAEIQGRVTGTLRQICYTMFLTQCFDRILCRSSGGSVFRERRLLSWLIGCRTQGHKPRLTGQRAWSDHHEVWSLLLGLLMGVLFELRSILFFLKIIASTTVKKYSWSSSHTSFAGFL